MKRQLLAGVAVCALLPPALASAADLSVAPAPAPVAAPVRVFTWTGFYVGGNAGGKWADYDLLVTTAPFTTPPPFNLAVPAFQAIPTFEKSSPRFTGGGQIGFNWQVNQFVFGAEGDFSGTNITRTGTTLFTTLPTFRPEETFTVRTRWEASARVRAGYALDRVLFYATGGAAFTDIRVTAFNPAVPVAAVGPLPATAFPAYFAEDSKSLTGWTAGAGIEFAVLDNVSIGGEYRYSDYGHHSLQLGQSPATVTRTPGATTFTYTPVSANLDVHTHEVLAKVNFKFGGLLGLF